MATGQYIITRAATSLTWIQANSLASDMGGQLASLSTPEENTLIVDALTTSGDAFFVLRSSTGSQAFGPWIGLVQDPSSSEPAGGWRWLDGSTYSPFGWIGGQPDNFSSDHVAMLVRFGTATGWGDHVDNPTTIGFPANASAVIELSASQTTLTGTGGADYIIGGSVDNTINGKAGADFLQGMGGSDTFTGTVDDLTGNTITDLSTGERIIISDKDLSALNGQAATGILTLDPGKTLMLSNLPSGAAWTASFAPGTGTTLTLTTNVNHAPVLVVPGDNGALTTGENKTAVAQIAASDPDGDAISFSLAGGEDSDLFTIDSATGALSFISPPDFEAPEDADQNNIYKVTVQASDGSLSDQQELLITVSDAQGVTIKGSRRSDTINETQSAGRQPLPTNEDDKIFGNNGNDRISALDGDDVIRGGLGRDFMTGGDGRDTFDFNSIRESGRTKGRADIIQDFVRGQDKIDLEHIDAIRGGRDHDFKLSNAVHGPGRIDVDKLDADTVRVELFIDRDRRPDMLIIVNGVNKLTASDFDL